MALFISYSSQDRAKVDALTNALRKAQQQVWFDQELGGGDSWWNKILEQIRACEIFVVALSNNWLLSKPSQSELRYARELNRPILPVRIGDVDSMRVNPLATLQIIDYTNPTVDAGIQLVTAVHALRAAAVPLPDPLPEEPPVPFGYITRLGNTLSDKELTPQQQIQLLVELRSGYEEDGDDPSARSDIAQLLRMLRLRHDVTYRTRNEIDQVLASIEERDNPKPANAGAQSQATAGATTPTPPVGASPGTPAPALVTSSLGGSATASGGGAASRNRLMIIGGAAAVVAVIVAAIVFLAMPSGSKKQPTGPGTRPATGATGAPATPGRLDSILLSAADVAAIMGVPSLEIGGQSQALRTSGVGSLSNANCVGAFEPAVQSSYANSGDKGARTQQLHASNNSHRAWEAAVSFPNAEKARAFVVKSAAEWKVCAGQAVTLTTEKGEGHWTFGDVEGEPPTITMVRTPEDAAKPACQRVLSAVSDIVLDVEACAVGITDQGTQIAQKMSANVK
jgi:hypothetical protein